MRELDILFLFIFVLSIIFVINQIFKISAEILSENPQKIVYRGFEKISNYFFVSYLITYILIKFF
jgi:hypothetical protein